MKYTLKKQLFTTKLLNEKGEKLNLENSPFKVKKQMGAFSLVSKNNTVSPKLNSIYQVGEIIYGLTQNNEKCQINLATGKVSKLFLRQLGKYYVLPNGKIVKFNKELNEISTKLSAIVQGNTLKYPIGTFNNIIIKNQENNKFGVMDENGNIICPCIFDSEGIWFNFKTIRTIPEFVSDPLALHKIASLSSYTSNGITKIFDETHKVIFETSKKQSIIKLNELTNSVALSIYDSEYNISRIHNYNFTTGKLSGSALIKGIVVKYEKIEGDAFYGATRDNKNKLTLIDFRGKPITSEQFDTIEFKKMNNKTVAIVSRNNNYGIFDIRNRAYIQEPTKTYAEVVQQIKTANQKYENLKA